MRAIISILCVAITGATLSAAHAATANDYIFWGGYNSGTINRVGADGSNPITIATGQSGAWNLAVDRVNERVYWMTLFGDLRGADYDGSNMVNVQTVPPYAEGVAVDPATQNVYYSTYSPTNIYYAQADGSDAPTGGTTLRPDTGGGDTAIALDVENGLIYTTRGGRIYRAPLDGSGSWYMLPNAISANSFGIALDVANGKVYWTSYLSVTDSWIYSANLDGTGGTDIVVSGLAMATTGLALNPGESTLYFTQDGRGGGDPVVTGVYSVPTTGGTPTLVHQITTEAYPRGVALSFVPEPASLVLLASGGLLLLRRKRA